MHEDLCFLTPFITTNHSLLPPAAFEYDFSWDDEELQSLLCKEMETSLKPTRFCSCVSAARKQAVEFVLTISSYHGFSASAAVLAINFVDRFLFDYFSFEKDEKPWLLQLVAVSCLSLAAKVEEIDVPLLVDLQVEDAKYLFEAKTIKRMELLILSALNWRMNQVTPLSFIDHFVRRLGLKKSFVIHLEFLTICENTIISFISGLYVIFHLFWRVLRCFTLFIKLNTAAMRLSVRRWCLMCLKLVRSKPQMSAFAPEATTVRTSSAAIDFIRISSSPASNSRKENSN